MPALQGHPRKDESFDIGEKKKKPNKTPEECSDSGAGLAKGTRKEAAAASVEGGPILLTEGRSLQQHFRQC